MLPKLDKQRGSSVAVVRLHWSNETDCTGSWSTPGGWVGRRQWRRRVAGRYFCRARQLLPTEPDMDEALEEFTGALREYAQDWDERLRLAPNHEHLWPLVLFVSMSSDSEIASWVHGGES